MSTVNRRGAMVVVCAAAFCGSVFGQTQQVRGFRGFGFIEGAADASDAMALSADGLYAAGACGDEAVRWSAKGPMSLGRLGAPFGGLSLAYGISGDGRMVVGFGRGVNSASPVCAFVWREGEGMMHLGEMPAPDAGYGSFASGVCADGTVIVGASDAVVGYPRAHMMTPELEWGPIMNDPSTASAVSADGRAVVGMVVVKGVESPFAWTSERGIAMLGDLPHGLEGGIAYGVNTDGTVVVGGSRSGASKPDYSYEAFRWTAAEGMIPLGDLPTGNYSSEARGVSADGSVVVGSSSVDPFPKTAAFIWEASHGMRDLREVLVNDYRMDLTGWELHTAQAISPDGRTIVGRGMNPDGQPEGWMVHLGSLCAADWNHDGIVASDDFLAFVDDFLCVGDNKSCPNVDFNGDGIEDSRDFFAFIFEFFEPCL